MIVAYICIYIFAFYSEQKFSVTFRALTPIIAQLSSLTTRPAAGLSTENPLQVSYWPLV